MANLSTPISGLILDELSRHEMRHLVLVVAVRKALSPADRIKGDLSAMVRLSLRHLVSARTVVESDGVFSLRAVP